MKRAAAIDCGTNSTRLLIVDRKRGDLVRQAEITRLGRGVDSTARLSTESLQRNRAVLDQYVAALHAHDVEAVRVVATSAARDAENRDELFADIKEVVGVDAELLPGEEEAQLSFAGATHELGGKAAVLVLDIGGGSTELVVGRPGHAPDYAVSLDIGSVRLTERFLQTDPPDPLELSQLVATARSELLIALEQQPELRNTAELIAVGGTATTVVAVELGLDPYDRDRVNGMTLTHAQVEEVFRLLATEALADRRHNPGLHPERADVIVGGNAILAVVMRTFEFPAVRVVDADLLDALVAQQLTSV